MSLNSLLDRLENVTPVTSSHVSSVTLKHTPHKVVTCVTSVTPKKSAPENLEITLEQEAAIRGWLFSIEEPEEDHHIVIEKCRFDPEALAYFLQHASEELNHE